MCCKYYFSDDTLDDIEEITGILLGNRGIAVRRDINPTDSALIITGKNKILTPEAMKWGFTGYDGNQLMINARAESALSKKSFSESVLERRCIIPAKHFYEWDAKKNKNTFSHLDDSQLYMAGFYNYFANVDEMRFIILTTAANESMIRVHDRMPLILSKDMIGDWIFDDSAVKDILGSSSPLLKRYQEYEQLTLF